MSYRNLQNQNIADAQQDQERDYKTLPTAQNHQRMPNKRMELLCTYLTSMCQRKQTQHDQSNHRNHPIMPYPTSPSYQIDILTNLPVAIRKSAHLAVQPHNLPEASTCCRRDAFNALHAKCERKPSKCAMKDVRYKYAIALVSS